MRIEVDNLDGPARMRLPGLWSRSLFFLYCRIGNLIEILWPILNLPGGEVPGILSCQGGFDQTFD